MYLQGSQPLSRVLCTDPLIGTTERIAAVAGVHAQRCRCIKYGLAVCLLGHSRSCQRCEELLITARRAALLQDRCRSCGCSRSVWRSDGLALDPPAGWVRPGLLTTCRPVGSLPWRGSKDIPWA